MTIRLPAALLFLAFVAAEPFCLAPAAVTLAIVALAAQELFRRRDIIGS
jgi:hypothetical protein